MNPELRRDLGYGYDSHYGLTPGEHVPATRATQKSAPTIVSDKGFIVVLKGEGRVVLKNGMLGDSVFNPNVKVYRCTLAEYEHVNGPLESGFVWTPWSTETTTITKVG